MQTLQKWWDPEGVHEWRRTPGSGGSPLKEGFDLAGDITTTDKSFQFHVEIKKDAGWGKLDSALTAPKWKLWDFVSQASDDCPRHRYPLLIFMAPGPSQPRFVAFWHLAPPLLLHLHTTRKPHLMLNYAAQYQEVCIMTLQDFMKFTPDEARSLFKT